MTVHKITSRINQLTKDVEKAISERRHTDAAKLSIELESLERTLPNKHCTTCEE